jgi:DeoR family transcriptional regulator, suf operon transcriptional repressor
MSVMSPKSDNDLMDLLKSAGTLGVKDLAKAMEVTPTAIRQRLIRLQSKGMIQREAIRKGRGRPKHRYWLTEKGMQATGSNFNDLAMALWAEIRRGDNVESHPETLRRIARTLAASLSGKIQGATPLERTQSLARLLAERNIPVTVEPKDGGILLTTHGCPYPSLSATDKEICEVERMMFSELLGQDVVLTKCRMAGDTECQFQVN